MPYKASCDIYVKVTCDSCGRIYDFSRTLECRAETETMAIFKLRETKRKLLRFELHCKEDYPYYIDCPQCGYVPRWMIPSARKEQRSSTIVSVVFLTIVFLGGCGYGLYWLFDHGNLDERSAWLLGGGLFVLTSIFAAVRIIKSFQRINHADWPNTEWLQTNERPTTITLPRLKAS